MLCYSQMMNTPFGTIKNCFDECNSEECMNSNGIPYVQDHIHNNDFKIHNQEYEHLVQV